MASVPVAADTESRDGGTAPPETRGDDAATVVELVLRVGGGDRDAEAALVERFSRGLYAYLRRLGCPPALAEDLHQESFRVLLERLRGRGLEEPAGLPGFVRGIARNLYLAERRKVAVRQTAGDEHALARTRDPRSGQLRRVLDVEAAALVRRLIGDLEVPRDRQILFRFYIAEDDKETICRDLELSSQHFNRVLFRARRRFKKLLEGAAAVAP